MAIDFVAFRITLSMFHNSKRIYSNIFIIIPATATETAGYFCDAEII